MAVPIPAAPKVSGRPNTICFVGEEVEFNVGDEIDDVAASATKNVVDFGCAFVVGSVEGEGRVRFGAAVVDSLVLSHGSFSSSTPCCSRFHRR